MLKHTVKKRLPKSETRENLVQTALQLLDQDGLEGLKARSIAEGAGVALGTIYNMFEDLDGLILEANSRTFAALGAALNEQQSVTRAGDYSPIEALMLFAEAYIDFVLANSNRWQATLAYASTMSERPPAWYIERQDNLFAILEDLLSKFEGVEDIEATSRAMWCSVHGIVSVNYRTPMHPEPKPVMMAFSEMVIRALVKA